VSGGEEFRTRPVKPFERGRPWLRLDAGPMQIQSWEGAALSRGETVLQGTSTFRAYRRLGTLSPAAALSTAYATKDVIIPTGKLSHHRFANTIGA
jgi:hypothetical protein